MEFWLRYALALIVVGLMLGALSLLGRAVQRSRFVRGSRRMEVIESLALTQAASLHLVRVDSRYLLLGAGSVAPIGAGSDETATDT